MSILGIFLSLVSMYTLQKSIWNGQSYSDTSWKVQYFHMGLFNQRSLAEFGRGLEPKDFTWVKFLGV